MLGGKVLILTNVILLFSGEFFYGILQKKKEKILC